MLIQTHYWKHGLSKSPLQSLHGGQLSTLARGSSMSSCSRFSPSRPFYHPLPPKLLSVLVLVLALALSTPAISPPRRSDPRPRTCSPFNAPPLLVQTLASPHLLFFTTHLSRLCWPCICSTCTWLALAPLLSSVHFSSTLKSLRNNSYTLYSMHT